MKDLRGPASRGKRAGTTARTKPTAKPAPTRAAAHQRPLSGRRRARRAPGGFRSPARALAAVLVVAGLALLALRTGIPLGALASAFISTIDALRRG